MSCGKVNGLEEMDICGKGESDGCCSARREVIQVLKLHTQHKSRSNRENTALTEGLILQLRETVACQEKRIQMLEKEVSYFNQTPPACLTAVGYTSNSVCS